MLHDDHAHPSAAEVEGVPPFTAELLRIDGGARVVIVGEVDAATASTFSDTLRAAVEDGGDVEIDMSGVSFIDSTGLRVLVEAQRNIGDERTITVVEASKPAAKLLAVTHLDQVFARRPARRSAPAPAPSEGLAGAFDSVTSGAVEARSAYEVAVHRNDDALRTGRNPQYGRGAIEVLRRRADEARDAVVLFGEATGAEVPIPV